ncbi:MAG: glycosyltransferase family A protein [Hyphomicrobium sp.]|uniref:glycosyltransferase family 2 protein n=1 Tax=Hyphomicrobium sp. TaxID=82 RepID=UPI0039E6325B
MSAYSVIIPAYNSEAFIADAIASVRAQTVGPSEIIVVDDGSTDRTADIVAHMGADIRLIRQANKGSGEATNSALRAVTTGMIAGLDSDDVWLPHKMETQLREFQSNPDISGCFARTRQFRDGRPDDGSGWTADAWTRTTMVIRTDVALAAGPVCDPPGGVGELVDWLARIREAGSLLHLIPEVLALRRLRPGSLTHKRSEAAGRGYLFAARRSVLRRRASSSA